VSEAALRAALEFHECRVQRRERRWARQGLRRPQYRLRVGDIRAFYDLSGTTVEVLAIVAKSEAESWLAQFGNEIESSPLQMDAILVSNTRCEDALRLEPK
jgi:hypothetical protein